MISFLDERLPLSMWNRMSPCPTSGCWLWIGKLDRHGYGLVSAGHQRWQLAHRVVWTALHGEVVDGLDLDHLCRVRCCVNPAHLEPVTRVINITRGVGPAVTRARCAAITHCPSGHQYDEANTYITKTGTRGCRACRRIAARERRIRESGHGVRCTCLECASRRAIGEDQTTIRYLEIVQLRESGLTQRDVAERLGISFETVRKAEAQLPYRRERATRRLLELQAKAVKR